MVKEGKSKNINFQLKGIEILDSYLLSPPKNKRGTKEYHFNLGLEHKIANEQKVIFVLIKVEVFHEDKKTLLGSLRTSLNFVVDNFEEIIQKKDKNSKVIIPTEFIDILNSISISTLRGMMFCIFRGTFLHNAVLPIIAPKSLKKEPKNP